MAKSNKVKKISKKELETLNQLQKEVSNVLAQIGNTEVVKNQLLDKHSTIQETWNENAKALEEKYGKVNIDLATGEVKEVEQEPVLSPA